MLRLAALLKKTQSPPPGGDLMTRPSDESESTKKFGFGRKWPKPRQKSGRKSRGDKQPAWWTEGVMFTCLPDCGRCCDEPDGLVYLSRDDVQRLAEYHGKEVEQWLESDCRKVHDGRWVLNSKEDRTCIYIRGDKRCDVHKAKPAQCRAYPFWGENMKNDQSWQKTKQLCPGLDHHEAILIDGETIKLHLEADAHSEQSFIDW